MCPLSPKPPRPKPPRRRPCNAVIAAIGTEAACSNVTLSGFTTNADSEAHTYSAKAPLQVPNTASPGLNWVTFLPTASTWPATSTPSRVSFAEYVCTSESALVLKPDNVTFEQAASVPIAAITALQGLRLGGLGLRRLDLGGGDKGQLQAKQKVLINGASGGVGTFAVQIAKSFGADVTGVCSRKHMDRVLQTGAKPISAYTRE